MKLKDIVKEIGRMGNLYRDSSDNEIRKSYEQYVELIITTEVEKTEQYNLCDYWERLKR